MRVVCVEGLFGVLLGSNMTNSLKARGVPVVTTSWNKRFEFKEGDIVCLHSFALCKLDEALKKAKHVFVLDGRMPPWGTSYKKEAKVWNYYQTGFVRGYEIKGAILNRRVEGLSHLKMPFNSTFILDFFKVYNEEKKNA